MKFAFDLDGVLCDINVVELYLTENNNRMEEWYYRERKPLLNPKDFLTSEDEYIIVTARKECLRNLTCKWLKKYLPDARWILIGIGYTNPREIASKKMKILRKEKVDIYFDDNIDVIKALRTLNEVGKEIGKKDIKFVHYSGRI